MCSRRCRRSGSSWRRSAAPRKATLRLIEPVDDEQLVTQVSPIMSPLVWDLAHIGWFEELWLIRRLANNEPSIERFDDLYDAFRHPREERSKLPILTPPEARAYLESVRQPALRVLEGVALDHADPLLRGAYVYGLVLQHELQHQETMLQTLQLSGVAYATPPHDDLRAPPSPEDVLVPAGPFTLGINSRVEPCTTRPRLRDGVIMRCRGVRRRESLDAD